MGILDPDTDVVCSDVANIATDIEGDRTEVEPLGCCLGRLVDDETLRDRVEAEC